LNVLANLIILFSFNYKAVSHSAPDFPYYIYSDLKTDILCIVGYLRLCCQCAVYRIAPKNQEGQVEKTVFTF